MTEAVINQLKATSAAEMQERARLSREQTPAEIAERLRRERRQRAEVAAAKHTLSQTEDA